MILSAINFTRGVLNQYLKNSFSLDDDIVEINTVINPDGSLPEKNQNKVILSLINLERETLKPFYIRNKKLNNGNYATMPILDRFNIDLLITSNFVDYQETLKFLNASILFFQANQAIDASSFSNIPEDLKKLEFELEKISYHQMHSLWSSMGAKYTPSIIYKTRLIELDPNEIRGFEPAVKGVQTITNPS